MNCASIQQQIPLMLYGELSFDAEELVQGHLAECDACRGELALVKVLHHGLDLRESEVEGALLADCRRSLRVGVAAIGPPRKYSWFDGLTWGAFVKPMGALGLIALGFFGARLTSIPTVEAPAATVPLASRVRYVDQSGSPGQVQIVVEDTSQRTLSGATASEPIQRLLLAAARDSADAGLRVESMDILKSSPESAQVRRALIYALQHDPNAGVRLKALEGLRGAAGDSETRRALSQVLLSDENPGVRTQAIDLLTQKKEAALVGVLQELMRKEDNSYVRLKCQKVLHEMNASVETF